MMGTSKIIGAVEIGTSKAMVLAGEIVDGRSLNIVGMGQCTSQGVIKGGIVDFKKASDCAHAAILAAEQQMGASIEGVYLAQAGGHIKGFYNEAGINVSSSDDMVSAEDVEMVCQVAKSKTLPEDRTVIHYIRRPFRLDGRQVVNPELLEGQRLEVGFWTIHGELAKVSDAIHIVNGFSLHVDDLILSGLASGIIASTEAERKSGVLVIDIGSGVTDWVLYRDGFVEKAGSIPVGGDHITNDLSLGLRVNHKQAEAVKVRSAKAVVDPDDKKEKVWLNGDRTIGDRQIPQQAINRITNARVEEIFDVVRNRIGSSWRAEKVASGVILTGGTSRLTGITEAAASVFEVEARQGESPAWVSEDLRGPEYSTVLGLLTFGLNNVQSGKGRSTRRKRGLLAKLFG